MGSSFPVLGRLPDTVSEKLLSDNLEMMKQHMTEEGENLKRLLEESVGSLNAGERHISRWLQTRWLISRLASLARPR